MAVDKKITIHPKNALIYFLDKSSQHHFIVIDDQERAFLQFKGFDVVEVKFIGGRNICDRFESSRTDLAGKLKRKVFVDQDTDVLYDEKSGKIKFLKSTAPAKKKILIVDDSITIQKLLKNIINQSSLMEVVAVASCPSEARKILEADAIDLVTLDIHMPEMNGIDFLKTYLKTTKVKVVMISAVSLSEGPLVLEALSNGAITYIQKPQMDNIEQCKAEIIEKIEGAFAAKQAENSEAAFSGFFSHNNGLIAIGSSTGGTQALEAILTRFPAQVPPILIVQHIPAIFSKALADRLNTLCQFTVCEAEDNCEVLPNFAYIAPGGKQMSLKMKNQKYYLQINDDPPKNRFKPSVDYFFESLSLLNVKNLVGVILTGMGKDGAQGLLGLKNKGALTIAQDEKSSVVFGMPREAIRLGAATAIVSLSNIPKEIVKNFNQLKLGL